MDKTKSGIISRSFCWIEAELLPPSLHNLPHTLLGDPKDLGESYSGFSALIASSNFGISCVLGRSRVGDRREWHHLAVVIDRHREDHRPQRFGE